MERVHEQPTRQLDTPLDEEVRRAHAYVGEKLPEIALGNGVRLGDIRRP
jgi:hypothetical protein